MKYEIKGKRRERLLTHRGEARNFTRVLSRLAGSESMFVSMHSSLKKMKYEIKGKRRERLPTHRGEARNFTRVLSRLAGSESMFVFLK